MGFIDQPGEDAARQNSRRFEYQTGPDDENAWLEIMAIISLWLMSIAIGIYAFFVLIE